MKRNYFPTIYIKEHHNKKDDRRSKIIVMGSFTVGALHQNIAYLC